jgi:hypothetical protein
MLTNAMQAMFQGMLSDMLKNLPPEVQQTVMDAGRFVAIVDGRLAAIEASLQAQAQDLRMIKEHFGIDPPSHENAPAREPQQRTLTDGKPVRISSDTEAAAGRILGSIRAHPHP